MLVSGKQAAQELGVSHRRIQRLCQDDRIKGALKVARDWIIPSPVKVTPGEKGPKMRYLQVESKGPGGGNDEKEA